MIPLPERQQIVHWVDEANAAGARRHKACELLGIAPRSLQRWRQPGEMKSDGLKHDARTTRVYVPANTLSDQERDQVLAVANSAEFAHLPPSQIVPILAERGEYIASESTFYRVLREAKQLKHRLASAPTAHHKPKALQATVPNQLYSWDITYRAPILRSCH